MTFDEANDALWGKDVEKHSKALDAFDVEYHEDELCDTCYNRNICRYRYEDFCRFLIKKCNFYQSGIVGRE